MMWKRLPTFARAAIWGVLGLLGMAVLLLGYMSLRYSPEYMVRDMFRDLGTVYDYRFFPERELKASPDPFRFSTDASQESVVKETFQANPAVKDLEAFLEGTGTQAFLVIRNDAILYERYFMGYQRDSIVTSFSTAKSFDSAMIGIAIEDGLIKSADDPITDYIPELAERDPRFADIQIRHLLTMASGLRFDSEKPNGLGDDALTYEFNDLRHLALTETEIIEPPGRTFVYNDYNPLLLGLILERVTGKPVTAYLQEELWSPLGMEFDGSWSLDSESTGFELMAAGINGRSIDFAKLGRLYLNDGNWNGKQIVPADWVAQSVQDNGLIQDAPVAYGYLWWRENCNPASQDFFAWGNKGQFIYVSPAKNLIIVRNGERYGLQDEGEAWGEIFCEFAKMLP